MDAGCHNMNIECYNFFKGQEYFRHTKFLNEKIDLSGIKCALEGEEYMNQLDKTVHPTSDFLHRPWCTKNSSIWNLSCF